MRDITRYRLRVLGESLLGLVTLFRAVTYL